MRALVSEAYTCYKQGSIKVIESGTIRYIGYGLLLEFNSNFVLKMHHF